MTPQPKPSERHENHWALIDKSALLIDHGITPPCQPDTLKQPLPAKKWVVGVARGLGRWAKGSGGGWKALTFSLVWENCREEPAARHNSITTSPPLYIDNVSPGSRHPSPAPWLADHPRKEFPYEPSHWHSSLFPSYVSQHVAFALRRARRIAGEHVSRVELLG